MGQLDTNKNFLIIQNWRKYKAALLLPQNVVFKGEAVSMPFALAVIGELKQNSDKLKDLQILASFGEQKEYALLEYNCEGYKGLSFDEILIENTIYEGTILNQTQYTTIISVNGHYGYISGICNGCVGDKIRVSVVQRPENGLCFYHFVEVNPDADTMANDTEGLSEDLEDFLSKEELAVLTAEQRSKVQWLLDNVNGITRKTIKVIRQDIHLSFNPTAQYDLASFLSKNPAYFKSGNFWVSCYKDKDKENPERSDLLKLILYNSCDVVLELGVNASGIYVMEFSHDKNKSNAQYLMDKNQKSLIIGGEHIYFHENNYIADNYLEVGNAIFAQYEMATSLLPGLKATVRSMKEKAGVEYLILKNYLAYQEAREQEINQKLCVMISSNQAVIATTDKDGYSTGLEVGPNADVGLLYQSYDTDVCHVDLIREEETLKAELKENAYGDGYLIEFYTQHIDIDDWRKTGFQIRRRAGVKHLRLQQDSIHDFVYGGKDFDLFNKLNNGELISPEAADEIEFFDDKFNNVEEGNNQPLAIRKAVNNNDVFLIQGPPGTGKTSVIVEIIKQLVIHRGERVLVCSQAHAAVKNIYDRLVGSDERLKIGNIDVEETMEVNDIKEHPFFLRNNNELLDLLEKETDEALIEKALLKYEAGYETSSKDDFMRFHRYICNYFPANKPEKPSELASIMEELRMGIQDLGDEARAFSTARHYQELNVVMGTCIGIGMNGGLQHSGLHFDTVIIDEAGKANLSETTVPMQLGKKFILVGDQNQLPPYMDQQDIEAFMESSPNLDQTKEEIENAISSSLFEDFLEDEQFPEESKILLNYQYRMNPDIGNYISELFYKGELQNGFGTEMQQLNLEGFPNAVTFIDTSTYETVEGRNVAYESGSPEIGWRNEREAEIFSERLMPRLERAKATGPDIRIGVITPYREQRKLLMNKLAGSTLGNIVYTIDSIQGTEFDVVVLSLVRAFNTKRGNRKVGFVDDMRRLNVALSRAKKKLIVIGNLQTLCEESAHFDTEGVMGIKPVDVFRKLRDIHERTAEKTSLETIKDELANDHLHEGDIFENCVWHKEDTRLLVEIQLDGKTHVFPLPITRASEKFAKPDEPIDIKFLRIGEDGRAKFEFVPDVTIAEQVQNGLLDQALAECVAWDEEDDDRIIIRFEDDSEMNVKVYETAPANGFLHGLLDCMIGTGISLPVFIYGRESLSLSKENYIKFKESHTEGDKVTIEVLLNDMSKNYYIVRCGDIYGKVVKMRRQFFQKGQALTAVIYRMSDTMVTFNVD